MEGMSGRRASQVLLPHEGARKRLCAWRGRAAAKYCAEAAAAGDDPAAAPPAEEAGDEAESEPETEGAVAVRDRPANGDVKEN